MYLDTPTRIILRSILMLGFFSHWSSVLFTHFIAIYVLSVIDFNNAFDDVFKSRSLSRCFVPARRHQLKQVAIGVGSVDVKAWPEWRSAIVTWSHSFQDLYNDKSYTFWRMGLDLFEQAGENTYIHYYIALYRCTGVDSVIEYIALSHRLGGCEQMHCLVKAT